MDASTPSGGGRGSRRGLPPSSIALFALAAVLAGVAVLLATGTIGRTTPPPPPPRPGQAQLIDVVNVLRAQGLATEIDPKLFAPRGAFSVPGQGLRIDGQPLYVFIFPDAATAEREFAEADPRTALAQAGATPAAGSAPLLVQNSNVIAAYGGDDEAAVGDKVRAAIEELP